MRRPLYLSILGVLFYFCAAFGCNSTGAIQFQTSGTGGSGTGGSGAGGGGCTLNATKCDSTGAVLVCADGQTFTKQMTCPFVCAGGACAGMCKPGATQCFGGTPQTCSATGTWQSGSCAAGQVCNGASCTPGCFIGGSARMPGSANPSDPCQTCQPSASTSAWTNLQDGAACGNGQVCTGGMCGTQCDIGGTVYSTGTANPANPCQSCQPGNSTTAWTNLADGAGCGAGEVCTTGACVAGCFVAGTVYPSGTANPGNSCQSCQPAASTTAWSDVPDGAACGAGSICHAGSCMGGCEVAGTYYASGAPNPGNPCQTCQPGTSTSAFSNVADGTACGGGQLCSSGVCGSQCDIGGTVYPPGAIDPSDACKSCQPGMSPVTWSNVADGTSCAAGQVCSGGSCVPGCFVGGMLYGAGAANPVNACQSCQPAKSTTAWSSVADGAPCAAQQVCSMGSCISGCFIGGTVYTAGAANPGTDCQSCQPASSTTAWTADADGTTCAGGQVCKGGVCGQTVTFSYTGAPQSWVVPVGVTQVTITAAGAEGGADCYGTIGGKGASVVATIPVTPGESLVVDVGGMGGVPLTTGGYCTTPGTGGFNGGASGGAVVYYAGGGGGGASDVRRGGSALANRVVVAAGGGGGGANSTGGPGGAGGTVNGVAGSSPSGGGHGGSGGTQSAGGAGGAPAPTPLGGGTGVGGSLGLGGAGGTGNYNSGGGGGGGYYGGGGGGGCGMSYDGGGGGGGSSYAEASATGVTMTQGVQVGDGQIVIAF